LLIVNLGPDLLLGPAPEPLLAPVDGQAWRLLWSSEAPIYGGSGGPTQDEHGDWLVPGQAAVVLAPSPVAGPAEANKVLRSPSGWSRDGAARHFLDDFEPHLAEAGIGRSAKSSAP
jgi:hypothetical protein